MTFSGHLEEKIGVRLTVGLGCSIMVLGVLLTSVAVQLSVVLTAITYGCCFGLGLALAYAPPLGVAMKWFPKSKGLVNGIIGNFKYSNVSEIFYFAIEKDRNKYLIYLYFSWRLWIRSFHFQSDSDSLFKPFESQARRWEIFY